MSSKDIAEKIIDNLAEFVKEDHKAIDEYDHDHTVHTCRVVDVLGVTVAFHSDTKKDARAQAVAYFEDQFETESIVISDTWIEDNIESVKDLTDSSEKQ